MKKIAAFVSASAKVKHTKEVPSLYQEYLDVWASVPELGVVSAEYLAKNLAKVRGDATMLVIQARVSAGELASKPSRDRQVRGDYIATILDDAGREATYIGETQEESGKMVRVERRLCSGHSTYAKAQDWLNRQLSGDKCGPGYTGVIESDKLPIAATITRDSAVFAVYGRRKPGTVMHTNKSGGRGPWMKQAQTTRSSFSRG